MMTDITREEIAAYKTWIDSGKKTPVAGLARLNTIKKLNAFESALCNLALQALDARGGWRPINEAPKDGTKIWMNINNGGVETSLVAYWCTVRELWSDGLNSPLKRYGQHWMPLPTPPTQAKEKSDELPSP